MPGKAREKRKFSQDRIQLINADFRQVYAENVWDFAYMLHMGPEQVNNLTCIDCYRLVIGMAKHQEEEAKRQAAQNQAY